MLGQACERLPMRLLAYCLMPNHVHLALWPRHDGDVSRWMHWLLTTHVRRYRRRHDSSGHVWQGRFNAFPIEQDAHLLTVLRYIELNPVRAHLMAQAEDCDGRVPVPGATSCEACMWKPDRWHGQSCGSSG